MPITHSERERETVYVLIYIILYTARQPDNLDYVVRYYEKWYVNARGIIIRG